MPPGIGASIRHRLRLSHNDVKLILWLIIQIRPFKYVGDRTLSQLRKWELIQSHFEKHRSLADANSGHGSLGPLVTPTVRTLQRQLSTALRRAQTRLGDSSNSGSDHGLKTDGHIPKYKHFEVFEVLLRASPMADLELAMLELFNLLEAYKRGDTVGALPPSVTRVGNPSDYEAMVPPLPLDELGLEGLGYLDREVVYDDADHTVVTGKVLDEALAQIRAVSVETQQFKLDLDALLKRHWTMVETRITSAQQMLERAEKNESALLVLSVTTELAKDKTSRLLLELLN